MAITGAADGIMARGYRRGQTGKQLRGEYSAALGTGAGQSYPG